MFTTSPPQPHKAEVWVLSKRPGLSMPVWASCGPPSPLPGLAKPPTAPPYLKHAMRPLPALVLPRVRFPRPPGWPGT